MTSSHSPLLPIGAVALIVIAGVGWKYFKASDTYQSRRYFDMFVWTLCGLGCAGIVFNILQHYLSKF